MTRTSIALPLVLAMLSVGHGVATGQTGQDLAQLTVPANQLPAGCRLISRAGGFIQTNPAIVTDPKTLGFMHALVFGPEPGELDDVGRTPPTSPNAAALVEGMVARAARIEVGYAAAYEETDGAHEIGVFALRLKDPSAEKAPGSRTPRSAIVRKGSVVIFSWSDLLSTRSDQGCLDVVRRHIDRVQLK
jgi:hypothetical protein